MFIFSNLATSLDGKIATASREFFPLGTPEDRRNMQVLLARADAVLFGASTLRAFRRPRALKDAKKQPVNVILSSALEGVSPSWPFFKRPDVPRILFVSERLSPAREKAFAKTSEIILLKKPTRSRSIARQVIEALEKRGINRLLVEGGGSVMWDFVSENLIDEYHLTLTPRVVGGTEAPTLVDGLGFKPKDVLNLELFQCRVSTNEIFLIYRR